MPRFLFVGSLRPHIHTKLNPKKKKKKKKKKNNMNNTKKAKESRSMASSVESWPKVERESACCEQKTCNARPANCAKTNLSNLYTKDVVGTNHAIISATIVLQMSGPKFRI